MKIIFRIVLLLMVSHVVLAQTPGIPYQAVIMDKEGGQELPGLDDEYSNPMSNTLVSIRFSIYDINELEFEEIHDSVLVDAYGMINLIVGYGVYTYNHFFNDMDWNGEEKWLKVEIDFENGNNFEILDYLPIHRIPSPDNQKLSLLGDSLVLENGGGVSLTDLLANSGTDNQILSLTGSTLSLEDGGSVDFSNLLSNINIAIGDHALENNVAGSFSIAIGYQSQLNANDQATANTGGNISMGPYSLRGSTTPANNTGKYNVVLGYANMYNNTSGSYNVALGRNVLDKNSSGNRNISMGERGIYDNETGSENIVLGTFALYNSKAGSRSIALGSYSQQYANNTTVAYDNLNIFIGYRALRGGPVAADNTRNSNISIGTESMIVNTSGSDNIPIGPSTLRINASGRRNIALGRGALLNNTTGEANVAVGYNTGLGITTGIENTIIGSQVTGLPATLSNNIINADGAGNQRIRVIDNGNVGIGQTNPTEKLEVNGTIKATDINFTGLPTYADEAAATNGGLTTGDLYQTASGEIRIKL